MMPEPAPCLRVVPCTLREARLLVRQWHRHHGAPVGGKYAVAVADDSLVVRGVAIVGRPVARHQDDGLTLEVTRLCTDGCHNACSMLYGACRRVAFALGYRRLLTYTLPHEGGASLRAAGFTLAGETEGGSWNCVSRPREDNHPLDPKWRWEALAR